MVEPFLWYFRIFVIIPVIFSLLSTFALFILGSHEILQGLGIQFRNYGDSSIYVKTLGFIITGIDLYLIGIILLLFALGIYELFISKIDAGLSRDTNTDISLMQSQSLDKLKDKLLKTIVMALVVTFFKQLISFNVQTPLDLLFLAASILIIAISTYLMYRVSSDAHH
ncbi:YqhA family protein [Thermosynechococcaceae cyanobacterium Okahandja]